MITKIERENDVLNVYYVYRGIEYTYIAAADDKLLDVYNNIQDIIKKLGDMI